MGRRRRQSGHGLPIRRRSPAEDASAVERWFDTWYNIRTREDPVTEEQGDDELFGIWPRLHMRAAPLVVIHLETLAYVAAERLWPPCAPRLQDKNPINQTGKKVWELIKESVPLDTSFGDAAISRKHCNFFVNRNKATFNDMSKLIDFVEKSVKEKTGIKLEKEIKILE